MPFHLFSFAVLCCVLAISYCPWFPSSEQTCAVMVLFQRRPIHLHDLACYLCFTSHSSFSPRYPLALCLCPSSRAWWYPRALLRRENVGLMRPVRLQTLCEIPAFCFGPHDGLMTASLWAFHQ
ncbi:hypothetical protein IWZ00DRAFT_180943 [Phyllosticta capitalensis]